MNPAPATGAADGAAEAGRRQPVEHQRRRVDVRGGVLGYRVAFARSRLDERLADDLLDIAVWEPVLAPTAAVFGYPPDS